jgi:Tol biopolymer transport system component
MRSPSLRPPSLAPLALSVALALAAGPAEPASAQSSTSRASESSAALEANGWSSAPSISADGRYVAFHSAADNLVANDANFALDVFVRDRQTATTSCVSLEASGASTGTGPVNPSSFFPRISADGRYVAFASSAWNLAANPTLGTQVFRHDRTNGITVLVSAGPTIPRSRRTDAGSPSRARRPTSSRVSTASRRCTCATSPPAR